MAIFKDYSDDIRRLQSEVKTLQSIIANQSNEELIKTLVSEVVEIRQLLGEINQKDCGKSKPSVKPQLLNEKKEKHITTYAAFPIFSIPRKYDLKTEKFFTERKSGSKKYLNFSFQQLVAMVKGYKNGLSIKRMKKTNPLFKNMTEPTLRNYLYYWRAGSFNKTIRDNARKLGYSPDKLISKEVE